LRPIREKGGACGMKGAQPGAGSKFGSAFVRIRKGYAVSKDGTKGELDEGEQVEGAGSFERRDTKRRTITQPIPLLRQRRTRVFPISPDDGSGRSDRVQFTATAHTHSTTHNPITYHYD